MTPLQLEPSAHAPCTSTMFGWSLICRFLSPLGAVHGSCHEVELLAALSALLAAVSSLKSFCSSDSASGRPRWLPATMDVLAAWTAAPELRAISAAQLTARSRNLSVGSTALIQP